MDTGPTALFVDAATEHHRASIARLEARGIKVLRSTSFNDASHCLDELAPDLAIIAPHLPDGDGLDLLSHPALESSAAIVVIDGSRDPERARRAVLAGAGYVFSPAAAESLLESFFTDIAEDLNDVRIDSPQPLSRNPSQPPPLLQLGLLHGNGAAMDKLFRTLRKLADSDAHVLLYGESGSGKTLTARTIHQLSNRSSGPLISLHCGDTAAGVEAQLFGPIAKTGMEAGPGCIDRAFGGTLLLEEVTELSPELQLKLLEVLENSDSRRTTEGGAGDKQRIDVRIIAATSRHPDEVLKSGRLREDLYFRMASAPVLIPPLRARLEDIDALAAVFLREFNERAGTEKYLSRDALAVLKTYSWPGNVRELRRVIEQAFIMAEQQINPEHLPDLLGQPMSDGDGDVLQLTIGDSVQDAEKKLTLATLTYYKGDKRKAAQTLGVSLKTLYNRINAYRADQRGTSVGAPE